MYGCGILYVLRIFVADVASLTRCSAAQETDLIPREGAARLFRIIGFGTPWCDIIFAFRLKKHFDRFVAAVARSGD